MECRDPHSLYLTWAMRLGKSSAVWAPLGLFIAFFLGCSQDPERVNYAYLRSPVFFRADTTATNHPFCDGTTPFASKEECQKTRKYHLVWGRPEDTTKLIGYRIYLDTADKQAPAGKAHWNYVKDRPELASIIANLHSPTDSIVFIFGKSGFKQDSLMKDGTKIFVIDSTGREEEGTGNLVFGLVPVYGGGVTPGSPIFSYFQTTDKQPPDLFHPDFRPLPHGIAIAWERPTDRISFFDPSLDTGIIAGYRFEISLGGSKLRSQLKEFNPKLVKYTVGSEDKTSLVRDSIAIVDSIPTKVFYFLPDQHRSAKRTSPILDDSMHLEIANLLPQDTLKVQLFAIDSAGNRNSDFMEKATLHTTDITQPSQPKLFVDSLTTNGFLVRWSASTDTLADADGKLSQAGKPNVHIRNYRFTRILLRAAGEKTTSLDRQDTTIVVDTVLARDSVIHVRERFLPPGTRFLLQVHAEDSSGFLSLADTLSVATKKIMFTDLDSVLVCPPGLVPMPRGTFKLGDGAAASQEDEHAARSVTMGPYCIEPYEHRDSTGKRFVSNASYEQAEKACEEMVSDTSFQSRLCSEVEWERACEGPVSDSTALLHGIQSEGKNPSILQTSCNQGTNDSAMAMNFALRNAVCLTTEGVYDMAGNLSEWVRDPYVAKAYDTMVGSDTLQHGFTFADSTGRATHSIRGGNYLKTTQPQLALTQNLARCSNRDFPQQVRPKYREDCRSIDKPKIAVIYGSGLEGHRCIDLPGNLKPEDITDLIPDSKDSTRLMVFLKGKKDADRIPITPEDTTFKGKKPISARLTTLSLALVTFERVGNPTDTIPDILDATEMRDTSQAGLAKIFQREASNGQWQVRQSGGRYEISFQYANTVLGTRPARPFYSNRVIGFRCCSLAKQPVAPPDTIAANP